MLWTSCYPLTSAGLTTHVAISRLRNFWAYYTVNYICNNTSPKTLSLVRPRGRQWAILAYEISWFLFDFPMISLKNYVICCKSGWGWRVGLISELDFKEICFDFSWFQLDFNWFLHEVYEISFVADPLCKTALRVQSSGLEPTFG